MADDQSDYGDLISRRKFIELTGASGAAALAGCGGDSGATATPTETEGEGTGDTPTATPTPEQQFYPDASLKDISFIIPKNIQFNPYNPNQFAQIGNALLFDPFFQFNFQRGEFLPSSIQDWTINPKSAELTVHPDMTWSNGDPVTAEDVALHFRLGKHTGNTLWQYADSIEVTGEKTLTIHLSEKTNPRIVKHTIAADYMDTPRSVYKKYLDAIQNADSEEAKNQAVADLTGFTLKDPVSSGPWTKGKADKQRIRYKRRDDHVFSENINFGNYDVTYTGGNQASWQALLSNQVDAAYSLFTPPRIVANLPDHWMEGRPPAQWGYSITPNYNRASLSNRALRQAIMYVINRDEVRKNAGPRTKIAPRIPTGVSAGPEQDRYLGDVMDTFETYGKAKSMTKKATDKLNQAGFKKQGGTWKTSDGKTLKLPVLVPSGWSDWVTATQTITDQLSSFGFDSSMVSKDFGTVSGDWANGNFTLAAFYWLPGGARSSFPYFPLSWQLTPQQSGRASSIATGFKKKKITVPSRTGSGETTVDVGKKVTQLAQATSQDESRPLIHELAWVANQELPQLPMTEKRNQTWVASKGWDVPAEDSDKYSIFPAQAWFVKKGYMQYDPDSPGQ